MVIGSVNSKSGIVDSCMHKNINWGLLTILILMFFINPFFGFLFSLYWMRNKVVAGDKKVLYFFVSLLMGLVACTQSTKYGDISRVYEGVLTDSVYFRGNSLGYLANSRHLLFDTVNHLIWIVFNNLKIISLFWITCLYFLVFLSIEDLIKYKKLYLSKKEHFILVIAVLFCFVNFTQVTEIMKQGVATAMSLYAFTSYLLDKKIKGTIILFLALNIHLSILFYIPLFIIKWIPPKILYALIPLSLLMRSMDLLTLLSTRLSIMKAVSSDFYMVDAITESVELYSNQMNSFFSSDAVFFVYIYWSFLLLIFLVNYYTSTSLLIKICLFVLTILNLTYFENHNYTRLLTMLFPFYIFLYMEAMKIERNRIKTNLVQLLLFCTFIVNFRLLYVRLFTDVYSTAFMDNSIINLFIYPSFMYLL